MTFDKKVKAFQKVSNLYIVDISAKNKYGWGPPSSTFTFYNKGVGKSHFIIWNLWSFIFMKIEMRRSRKTFILYPDYSTQQIKYKEPKVEKEVKKVTFNSQHVEKPSIFQSSQQEEKLFICALSSCKSKGICFKKIPSQPRPSFIKGDLLNCPPPCSVQKWKKTKKPTKGSLRWRILLKNSSGWFNTIFQFWYCREGGTVKKSLCRISQLVWLDRRKSLNIEWNFETYSTKNFVEQVEQTPDSGFQEKPLVMDRFS